MFVQTYARPALAQDAGQRPSFSPSFSAAWRAPNWVRRCSSPTPSWSASWTLPTRSCRGPGRGCCGGFALRLHAGADRRRAAGGAGGRSRHLRAKRAPPDMRALRHSKLRDDEHARPTSTAPAVGGGSRSSAWMCAYCGVWPSTAEGDSKRPQRVPTLNLDVAGPHARGPFPKRSRQPSAARLRRQRANASNLISRND